MPSKPLNPDARALSAPAVDRSLDRADASDACAQLVTDMRGLLARVGAAVAASRLERSRAAEALRRLAAEVDFADRWWKEANLFGEDFAALYEELRASTEALSRAQRHSGEPPQEAVKVLKSLFVDSETTGLTTDATRVVEQEVVRWGIGAYYAA